MIGQGSDPSALLRWYPKSWRERYGEELTVLMEDELEGRSPTPRLRLSMAWSGLREHGHEAGLLGDTAPATERMRGGVLAVLCGWMLFVLAGASFSKQAEHFDSAVAPVSRSLPTVAFDMVWVLGIVAGALVLTGGLVAFPAFRRFVLAGQWRTVRRSVVRAAVPTAILAVATAGLSVWARSLTELQRNGGSVPYEVAFLACALLAAATLGLWTVGALAVGKRLELSRRVVAFEGALAVAATLTMVALTAAAAVWWAAMATRAPTFLDKTGTPFDPVLAVTMALMLIALIAAVGGAARIGRSWTDTGRPNALPTTGWK